MKHLSGNFAQIFVVILLLISSLSAPLLVPSKASAVSLMTVCQEVTDNTANTLAAPTLLTPSNGSTNPNGFDFSWSSANGAALYDWESSLTPDLNTDGSFLNRLGYHRLSATSINEASSPQATYYWHVRAVASDDSTSLWSQTWRSTINNAHTSYLSAPTLLFPSNGATCNIYAQDFDFTWSAPVSDGGLSPLTYIFQSGRSVTTDPVSGEFTDQPWTDNGIATTSIFDGGSPSATYYWHVRAVGNDGTLGPWSATSVVTITHDAPAPVETPPTTPPIQDTGSTSDTTPIAPVATPATSATPISTTSIPSLFIPPSADIAAVLGTDVHATTKAADHKTPNRANLTANIATVRGNLFTRNVIWIVALVLALSAAIFAYHRRQSSSK